MTESTIADGRQDVRKFGITFGTLCLLLAGWSGFRGGVAWPWFCCGAAFFFVTGLFALPILRPVYRGWMNFASLLGWVNTRILLGVFYYLVLTPMGLAMKLFGKDLLDLKYEPAQKSYWIKREPGPFDPGRCEQPF